MPQSAVHPGCKCACPLCYREPGPTYSCDTIDCVRVRASSVTSEAEVARPLSCVFECDILD